MAFSSLTVKAILQRIFQLLMPISELRGLVERHHLDRYRQAHGAVAHALNRLRVWSSTHRRGARVPADNHLPGAGAPDARAAHLVVVGNAEAGGRAGNSG